MNTLAKHKTIDKTITPSLIDARLNQRGFKPKNHLDQLSDPIAVTQMVVTLDQLRPYDNNPRTTRNSAFDEIKESIRARGLDNPPPITRRPGEEHYIIRNGGNTRLEILRELYKETRDDRYFKINCFFHPWESESSVLVGHLIENEMRGNLYFIEKAVGIQKLKDMLEADGDGKKLTQNELSKRLKDRGYQVSRTHISRMLECVNSLLPAIPQTLYAGLGKPPIEKLLRLRSGLQGIYIDHGGGTEEAFKEFWLSTLSGFDIRPEEFKYNRVEDEMIGRMSERIGRDFRMIQLDLHQINPEPESEQDGGEEPPTVEQRNPQSTAPAAQASGGKAKSQKQKLLEKFAPEPGNSESEELARALKESPRKKTSHAPVILPNQKDYLGTSEALVTALHMPSPDIEDDWILDGAGGGKSLLGMRIQSWMSANEIAKWGGNNKMAVKTERDGIGFTVNPHAFPEEEEYKEKADTVMFVLMSLIHCYDNDPEETRADLHGGVWSQVLFGGYEIKVGLMSAQKVRFACLPDEVLFHFFRLVRFARQIVKLQRAVDDQEDNQLNRG
ncbi:MAG: ParB N-terminal domain-containing protein [Burkholderiales bacterium]|jgi:ParB family protein of integrating conjugative element (PFGI_1 class)|nr:ParB N-terminal domain-containing protein [Burkholderiales bacterium]